MIKVGGYLSFLFAFWRLFKILLLMKYKNHQAKVVEEFEATHNIAVKEENSLFSIK